MIYIYLFFFFFSLNKNVLLINEMLLLYRSIYICSLIYFLLLICCYKLQKNGKKNYNELISYIIINKMEEKNCLLE